MQPVQDLTIEGTVSRTQYQFILQDADPAQLTEWTPKLVDKLNTLPRACRRGQRPVGARTVGVRRNRPRPGRAFRHHARDHRQCAVRFIRPAHRLDDFHQLEPVPRHPRGRSEPANLAAIAGIDIYLPSSVGGSAGAARGDGQDAAGDRAAAGLASRPVPVRHRSRSTLRRAHRSARR